LRFLLTFVIALACSQGQAHCQEDYWQALRTAAEDCYSGTDLKVTLGGGIEQRTFDSGSKTAPYAQLKLEVPLYAASERRSQKQEMGRFLEHGADIIRDLRKAEGRLEVKREEARVLRQAMIQGGLQGIRDFFAIKAEIAETRAEIDAYRKKLRGWIETCGRR